MRGYLVAFSTAALLLGACADDSFTPDPEAGQAEAGSEAGWPDTWISDQFVPPDGFIIGKEVVYAHTAEKLFKIDPQTLQVTEIGAFAEAGASESPRVTDLALDKRGNMIAVTKKNVYSVDVKTAACTKLSTAKAHYVGLSYVVDNESVDKREYLMGLGKDGTVYEIDPKTGDSKTVGSLGKDPIAQDENLRAAGDIVSVRGFKTLVTVERPRSLPSNYTDSDWLAEINELTGEATLIDKIGYKGVWGLGFWKHEGKNKVFGFTNKGEFLLIDTQTGKGTLQSR